MNTRDPVLPFFVYGTLRRAHTNYLLFRDSITKERMGFLERATMTVSGVPFVHLDYEGEGVVGEVITVAAENFQRVLLSLDTLEGYHGAGHESMYDREIVKIRLASGEYEQCWTYLVTPDRAADQVIESGDYADYRRRR